MLACVCVQACARIHELSCAHHVHTSNGEWQPKARLPAHVHAEPRICACESTYLSEGREGRDARARRRDGREGRDASLGVAK